MHQGQPITIKASDNHHHDDTPYRKERFQQRSRGIALLQSRNLWKSADMQCVSVTKMGFTELCGIYAYKASQ